MSDRDAARDRRSPASGAATPAGGTPMPVEMSLGRIAREQIAVFLAGPVIWGLHFGLVYLVSEAGCTGTGPGLRLLDPPVPVVVTLAATAVAATACLACAWWGYRRWSSRHTEEGPASRDAGPEEQDAGASLAFIGALLSVMSFVSVLMVGLPALWLSPC